MSSMAAFSTQAELSSRDRLWLVKLKIFMLEKSLPAPGLNSVAASMFFTYIFVHLCKYFQRRNFW